MSTSSSPLSLHPTRWPTADALSRITSGAAPAHVHVIPTNRLTESPEAPHEHVCACGFHYFSDEAATPEPAPALDLRGAAEVLCDWIDRLEARAHGEFGVWVEERYVSEARDEVRKVLAAMTKEQTPDE